VSRHALYVAAGATSALVLLGAVGLGFTTALRQDGALPTPDLRYMPQLSAMFDAGRFAEARGELYMASKLDPRNQLALEMLHHIARDEADTKLQLHALRLMVAENPEDPALRIRLSKVLIARARQDGAAGPPRRQLERAIASAELALRSDPSSALAHQTLGEAWLLLGDQEEAERHLREALRLDPTLEAARRGLERAHAAGSPS